MVEKTLTFSTAKRANKDPYPRKILSAGPGSSAGPIPEAAALHSSFPTSAKAAYYRIGVGDQLSYSIFSEAAVNENIVIFISASETVF